MSSSASHEKEPAPGASATGGWASLWLMLKSLLALFTCGRHAEAERGLGDLELQIADRLMSLALKQAGLTRADADALGARIAMTPRGFRVVFDDDPAEEPPGALPYSREDLASLIESRTLFFRFQRMTWFAERFSTLLARYRRKRTGKLQAVRAARAATRASGLASPSAGDLAAARAPP